MTQLYLIRHAEAEGNIYRRLHGQYDSLLTANGLRQVQALRKRFSDLRIDAVYASDLTRTCQTAQAITLPKGLPLHRDARLREVGVGIWEGCCFGELEQSAPEQLRCFLRDPEHWHVEGAESFEAYSARFAAALTEIAEANDGKTVAVFTHGCVLSGGLHRLLGLPHNASACDNTGVSLLRYMDGRFTPLFLYDSSHLSEDLSTHARQRWWREKGGFNLRFRDPEPADSAIFDEDCLPRPDRELRVAMLKDEAVGCVGWRGETLSVLYLRPEFRHMRMGDQLIGEAVQTLRGRGCTRLIASFPTVNREALCFFTHLGASVEQMDDVFTVCALALTVPV